MRKILEAPYYIINRNIHVDLKIETLTEYMSKQNVKFYRDAPSCEEGNFNQPFKFELLPGDDELRPIAAFFASDAVLSKAFA